MTEDDVVETFLQLPDLVNRDAALIRRGRTLRARFLIGAGATPVHLTVHDGRIAGAEAGAALMRSWDFAIRADGATWARFWEPVPAPGYHDLLALTRFGRAVIEGDLAPLMRHLRYVKEVLALPRGVTAGASDGG